MRKIDQVLCRGIGHNGGVNEPAAEERPSRAAAHRVRIDAVIAYMERHLDEDLSLERLSEVACFSPFHFHRQFHAATGMTAAELVRLLRLRRAALRLAFNPLVSVTDVALDHGFGSAEAFSRAFKRVYGRSPAAFRKSPAWRAEAVPVVPSYQESRMNKHVEIVEFPTTRVACVEYQGPEPRSLSATMQLVAWRRENGVSPDQGMTLGVHYSDPRTTPPEDFRLDICVSYDGEIAPNEHGVIAKTIPGGRCARMRHLGSRNWMPEPDYLYAQWLPDSDETPRDFPLFFHYVNVGPDVRDADMITDIYLPLV